MTAGRNRHTIDPRVVYVSTPTRPGFHKPSSGYLIAEGWVLASDHSIGHGLPGCRQIWETESHEASEKVALGHDAVLLKVPGVPAIPGQVICGDYVGTKPLHECSLVGFPKASANEYEHFTFTVRPGEGDWLKLDVESSAPIGDGWKGLSGAAVIAPDNSVLGIIAALPEAWTGRLHAVRITSIARALRDQVPSLDIRAFGDECPLLEPRKRRLKKADEFTSDFELLWFGNRVVPFVPDGRQDDLDDLLRWCRQRAGEPSVKARLLLGPGGSGKSRLADELSGRLNDDGWHAGFASKEGSAPWTSYQPTQRPLLAVFDYVEQRPEVAAGFLARMIQKFRDDQLSQAVRLLLVSRSDEGWFKQVDRRGQLKSLTGPNSGSEPLLLNRELDLAASQAHLDTAFMTFCRPEYLPSPDSVRPNPDLSNPEFQNPLVVHIAALLGANGEVLPDLQPEAGVRDALLGQLLDREKERWTKHKDKKVLKLFGPRLDLSTDRLQQAVCVTTLTAPTVGAAVDLLKAVPHFADTWSELDLNDMAEGLRVLYADSSAGVEQAIAPVQPDLIAAHLISDTSNRSEIITNLLQHESLRPAHHTQMLTTLSLAGDHYPSVAEDFQGNLETLLRGAAVDESGSESFRDFLANNLPDLVAAAKADVAQNNPGVANALASALAQVDYDERIAKAATAVVDSVPHPTVHLANLAVTLTWADTQHYSELAETNRDVYLPGLAASVNSHALRLADVGRRGEALHFSQRAVDLREELMAINRDAYLPDLATSVDNHAIRLAEAGRRGEALQLSQRAVGLREELAAINRDAYLPDLATSVNNHAVQLAEAGQRGEALRATQRAVDLREELMAINRDAYLPNLARSVNNHVAMLAAAGRRNEALEVSQRAVELSEELAEANRDAYLPDLATSVNNHVAMLAAAGRRNEALEVSQRAVGLREELVAINRDAYLPDLATSVDNYALALAAAGRRNEALEVSQRAVGLREELVAINRDAYLPDLATSVDNQVIQLVGASRHAEALEMSQRAVNLREELVRTSHDAHLPELAGSVCVAASIHASVGTDLDAALNHAERGVSLFKELSAREAAGFNGKLSSALDLLAGIHDARGEYHDAAAVRSRRSAP